MTSFKDNFIVHMYNSEYIHWLTNQITDCYVVPQTLSSFLFLLSSQFFTREGLVSG